MQTYHCNIGEGLQYIRENKVIRLLIHRQLINEILMEIKDIGFRIIRDGKSHGRQVRLSYLKYVFVFFWISSALFGDLLFYRSCLQRE